MERDVRDGAGGSPGGSPGPGAPDPEGATKRARRGARQRGAKVEPDEVGHRPVPSGRGGFEHPVRGIARERAGRRGDILDAALRLFATSGYTNTGVQDIAWEAQASVGSVYHHFDGKEDIAAAIYTEGLQDYHRGLHRELRREHETAEEAVKRLVVHHLRWVDRNAELAHFLFTSRDPEVVGASRERLEGMNQRIFEAVQIWRKRWVEAGAIQDLPLAFFHAIVLGPSQEFARHWVAGRVKQSIDEAEPVLAEAAWKAVRT